MKMTGKGEYYVRCKNCGKLIKVFNTQTQMYCTNCGELFDYDTQDVVFSGISTIPSDYHYEWKEEKNIEVKLSKYKRAFEIFKGREVQVYPKLDGNTQYVITLNKEEYELLEELMKNENC